MIVERVVGIRTMARERAGGVYDLIWGVGVAVQVTRK